MTLARISWDEYFLSIAYMAALRSPDAQTKCGCVITDSEHRILSLGYNGFVRGFPDDEIPNTRPEKYEYVLHAERNALHNAIVRPSGGIAYVTGKPCIECLKALLQEGVREIIYGDNPIFLQATLDETHYNKIIEHAQRHLSLVFRMVTFNWYSPITHLNNWIENLKNQGRL